MIFHNRHTISIGRLAVLMDSQDYNLVRRVNIPLPEKMLKKAYAKLIQEVIETLNSSALQKEIESGILRTKLYNKAFNLYPALINIVHLTWDEEHLNKIEEITGYKLNSLEDRKILIDEMERLQGKFRELSKSEKKEGVSFSQVIVSTEIVLGFPINPDTKLFMFQHYMKKASEKIMQLEKQQLKK